MIPNLHKLPAAGHVWSQPIQSSLRNADRDAEPIQQDTKWQIVSNAAEMSSRTTTDVILFVVRPDVASLHTIKLHF